MKQKHNYLVKHKIFQFKDPETNQIHDETNLCHIILFGLDTKYYRNLKLDPIICQTLVFCNVKVKKNF